MSLKQIFKSSVPNEYLFNLLDKICFKTEQYYYIDVNAYNKMRFYKYHEEFFEQVKPYYHLSKRFYVERTLTYNYFINVVRQICKNNSIYYTSKMNYNESKYNIDYYIYFQRA
jgi:hypothetical protein